LLACGELAQSGRSVKQEPTEAIKASRRDAVGIPAMKGGEDVNNMDSNLVGSCLVYLVYCKLVQMDVEAAANTEYFQKKAYALVTDLAPFFGKAQDKLDVFLKTYEPVDDAVFRVDMDLTRRWMYVTFVSKSPPVRKRNPLIVPLRPVYDYMHDAEFLESMYNDELEDPTEKDS
jgi:hypothetical protein